MAPERHRQISETFQHIADVPPNQRGTVLAQLCAGDHELRREVESLLRHHHDQADEFHDANVGVGRKLVEPAHSPQSTLPTHIGRFRIIRRIGEGGMGVVFEAEQEQPRRTVALKVIRAGLASDSVVRRFRHEAEVLGRLKHPGIADVYEAGVAETPLGPQPYFAMQFIYGLPLTEYAKRNQLDTRARLDLFARICDAVQYAHQRGIIHRDLKPANILVSDEATEARSDEGGGRHRPPSIPTVAPSPRRSVAIPKILDFGVARVADGEMTLATMQTVTGQVIGTLPYMSPEQVAGRAMDVDTRSDVYSLGVTLYELLAERLPYKVTNCTLPEAARIISDVEPTHLSVVDRRFRGDVETIVTKALQKDRAQRYASVAELAADIRRYLADEPVQARPPSAMYQLRKFARRNKALVGGTIGIFAALVLGLAGVLWFAAGESRQRATAETASSEARRLAYRVSVGAAADALAENNTITARRLLNDAPAELRGWEWRHLQTALDTSDDRFRIEGVTGGSIHPRADGTLLVRELARVVHVDMNARRAIATYASESARAIAVDVALNLIARPAKASQVVIHNLESGEVNTIPAPNGLNADDMIGALRFSNDSRFLAVSYTNGTLVLHDVRSGTSRWTAKPATPNILDLSFDPRDRAVAVCGLAGAEIFSVETGALVLRRATDSLARFIQTQWSPDGSTFYRREWTDDRKQHFFTPIRVDSGDTLSRWPSHPRELVLVQAASDFSTALAISADGVMRLIDPATGKSQVEPSERATGHTAIFSPDEQRILFTQLSGTIGILDRRSGARLGTLRGPESPGALAFSPDGRQLLCLTSDGTLRIWDYSASGEPNVLRGHDSFVYPVTFSPNGRTLASGGWDRAIRLWDVQTRRELRVLRVHTAPVYSIAFSSDGRWLLSQASAAESEHLLWDVETGTSRTLPRLDGESLEPPRFVDATPRIWLPGSVGPTQRVWNAETDQIESLTWDEVAPRLESLGSSNTEWLVRLRIDPTTRTPTPTLFSTRDHAVTRALPEPAVRAVLNRDGTRLATIETPISDAVVIWDVATGTKLRTLTGHIGEVFDVRFSPDGERLATAGRDGAIRIWDATRFELLVRLRGHTDYVWGLNWSPDGGMLVSGSGDTTIRLWPSVE